MTFQRILITGASSGLGAELARQLAGPDVTVVLVGRNIDRLEQVAEASRAYRTYYRVQDGDDDYYLVDHSTFTYLVLPGHGFVEFFRRDISPDQMAETIAFLVKRGIPVMAHIGLTPQAVNVFGGYKIQGKGNDEKRIIADAVAVEKAGAFSVVCEKVPDPLARKLTKKLSIPTIGIGDRGTNQGTPTPCACSVQLASICNSIQNQRNL